MPGDQASTQGAQQIGTQGEENDRPTDAVLDQLQQCRLVLIIPYIKGIGEKLQQIAKEANCGTWWMYLGWASDRFSSYKEHTHQSKVTNTVYCTECSCALKYIGEMSWNLKVHLHGHLHESSKSTLSVHFLEHKNLTGHKLALQNTTVLAKEVLHVEKEIDRESVHKV